MDHQQTEAQQTACSWCLSPIGPSDQLTYLPSICPSCYADLLTAPDDQSFVLQGDAITEVFQ